MADAQVSAATPSHLRRDLYPDLEALPSFPPGSSQRGSHRLRPRMSFVYGRRSSGFSDRLEADVSAPCAAPRLCAAHRVTSRAAAAALCSRTPASVHRALCRDVRILGPHSEDPLPMKTSLSGLLKIIDPSTSSAYSPPLYFVSYDFHILPSLFKCSFIVSPSLNENAPVTRVGFSHSCSLLFPTSGKSAWGHLTHLRW